MTPHQELTAEIDLILSDNVDWKETRLRLKKRQRRYLKNAKRRKGPGRKYET